MRAVKASEFKAKCLALMDEVAETGEGVVITKHGRPVADLVPHGGKRPVSLFGFRKGVMKIKGDILSPIDVPWKAMEE